MMAIRILCGCGQKYAFDVEPVEGRISQAVQSPVCGADGTTIANQKIAQQLPANAAPASELRFIEEQPPSAVPLTRRIPTAENRDIRCSGMKLRNKWFVLGLGGAVASILVLGGAIIFGRSGDGKAAPVAEAKDGVPQTLAELNAWYVEPPAGQNAAAFYLKGCDALQLANASALPILGRGQLPPPGTPIPAPMKSALAALVKSNRDALRLFADGAKLDRCRYPMALAALADPQQLLRALSAPDLKMPADRRSLIKARLQTGQTLTAERDFFEASFRQLVAARQEPFPARLKSDDLGRQLVAEALDKKLVVLDLLLPSLGRRTVVEAECVAWLRLGRTAVALEEFRATHGKRYPVTLSELNPDYLSPPPADPFDGRPLRYRKSVVGYVLHSIGPDLKDDSGARKNGKDGDIAFAVITPARADR